MLTINQRSLLRIFLVALLFYTAVFFFLSALGNVTAYDQGREMIQNTLSMKNLPAHAGADWRAVHSSFVSDLVFVSIYVCEFTISLLAVLAAIKLWWARNKNEADFQQAKTTAFVTIGLIITLTFFGFLCLACQWFRMWMSTGYNGQTVFFQITMLYCLIFIIIIKIR